MSTGDNQSNDSNIVSPNENSGLESSFNFKGFPYVISILTTKTISISVESKHKFKVELIEIIKKISGYNSELHILTNGDSYEIVKEFVSYLIEPKIINVSDFDELKNEDIEHVNEFIAKHSHLMIVLGDEDIEKILNKDKILKWTIQYKLEGYPGSESQQVQAEKITYPANGPVLFINKISKYCFPSRKPITIEGVNKKHERILNLKHIKNCKIKNNVEKTIRKEIYSNLRILEKINNAIQKDRYKKYLENPINQGIESLSFNQPKQRAPRVNQLPNQSNVHTPEYLQPLIKCYHIVNHCAERSENSTKRYINLFCTLLFLVLICNAVLIYLNDVCITSTNTNAVIISQNYIENARVNGNLSEFKKSVFKKEILPFSFISYASSSSESGKDEDASKDENTLDTEAKQRILSHLFIYYLTLLYFCIIIILLLGLSYLYYKPHYLYHRFKALADCLRVQVYWKYAGLTDNVSANFRAHQIPEIDWLIIVLNSLEINFNISQSVAEDDVFSILDKYWLEDRIFNEFKPALKKELFKRICERLGWFFPVLSFFLVLLFPLLCLRSFVLAIFLLISTFGVLLALLAAIATLIWILFGFLYSLAKHSLLKQFGFRRYLHHQLGLWRFNQQGLLYVLFIKNLPLIISFLVTIYFCFSGLFEIIRLSSLCACQKVVPDAFEILFANFIEIMRIFFQIVVAFVLIYYLFIKMHMFDKERRRIELLLPCFNVADYSIDVIRSEDDVLKKIETEESIRIKKRVYEILNTIDDPSDLLLSDSEIEPIQSIIYRIKNEMSQNVKPDKPFSFFKPSTWKFQWPWGKRNNSKSTKISNEKQQLINDLEGINHLLLEIKSVKEKKFYKIIEQKEKESFTGDNISKTDFCQQILRELGQEVLAKRIDWLLDVNDRNLQRPK